MAGKRHSNEGNGGTLIDTWWYQYKGIVEEGTSDGEEVSGVKPIQTVQEKKVKVEVRLMKKFRDSDAPPLATKEVWFVIVCKEAEFKLEGTDIEALRVAMWEKLDTKFEIKWERYFLVRIDPMSPYDGIGSGFTFGYDWVEKGVAWDGTLVLRERPRFGGEKVRPWPGEFKDKMGRVMACIPHTEQNHDSLREFSNRIDSLRQHLADFLKPEVIMKTLASMSGGNFLLPPADKSDQEG
jgi:hypothetical protein